jgi:hypothetical protein
MNEQAKIQADRTMPSPGLAQPAPAIPNPPGSSGLGTMGGNWPAASRPTPNKLWQCAAQPDCLHDEEQWQSCLACNPPAPAQPAPASEWHSALYEANLRWPVKNDTDEVLTTTQAIASFAETYAASQLAVSQQEITDAYDAIFPFVPEAQNAQGELLSVADKIELMGQNIAELERQLAEKRKDAAHYLHCRDEWCARVEAAESRLQAALEREKGLRDKLLEIPKLVAARGIGAWPLRVVGDAIEPALASVPEEAIREIRPKDENWSTCRFCGALVSPVTRVPTPKSEQSD